MYSLITRTLPKDIFINNKYLPIDTRTCIALECIEIMENKEVPIDIRITTVIRKIVPRCAEIPSDSILQAYELVGDYLNGWEQKTSSKPAKKVIGLSEDHYLIVSAFRQSYGVSLRELKDMHWWEFLALLDGIPESTRLANVMSIRNMEVPSKASPEQKAKIRKAKQAVALRQDTPEGMSGEDIVASAFN